MERIEYAGWPNCVRLRNEAVELVVTADVGPRVIRFGFAGGPNEFHEVPAERGKTGGTAWRPYGGHRLWHAPENDPRTYSPDNDPVEVQDHGAFVRFVQKTEAATGIGKELDVALDPSRARARLTHRLINRNAWTVTLAPWAISVLAPGGVAILPLPPRGEHPRDLLPTSSLTLWAYTEMNDPRWTWGRRYVLLRHDGKAKIPQKAGIATHEGWAAYARGGNLFLKRFASDPTRAYPDFGCTVESFTNSDMLELETLGALGEIEPGACAEHAETWELHANVPMPKSDADVERDVLPRVAQKD